MNDIKTYRVLAAVALLIFCSLVPDTEAAAFTKQDVDEQLEQLKDYEYQADPKVLRTIEAIVRQCQDQGEFSEYVEQEMARFLKSDATTEGKWFVCKQLWIIGTEVSVPSLAEMLADEKTAEMACFALRSNQSAAAGEALRQALQDVGDNTKVRIINILGDRRERKSIPILSKLVSNNNADVAESAAVALGKIGGESAIKALERFRSSTDAGMKAVATEAYLQHAEFLALQGRETEALSIYNEMLKSDDALFRRSALLGIMNIEGPEALARVKSVLYGDDEMLKHTAIANSPRLKAENVISELVAELPRLEGRQQSLLIYALAETGDASVRPAITEMTQSPRPEVRQAALEALGIIGDKSSVKTLCKAIADDRSAREKNIALASLRRISGAGVESAIIDTMQTAEAQTHVELIRVLSDRRASGSVPALLDEASSRDSDVCKAAFRALGKLAGEKQLPILIERYLNLADSDDGTGCRSEAERAIIALAKKIGNENQRADEILGVFENEQRSGVKCSLLRILGGIGNDKGLKVIQQTLSDKDEQVRDTAIRELAAWPNTQAVDSLLDVMAESANDTHRILAFRGYVRLLRLGYERPTEETLAMYEKALGFAKRPEEKKLVLSGLADVAAPQALQIIEPYLNDEAVASEAAIARDKILSHIEQTNKR